MLAVPHASSGAALNALTVQYAKNLPRIRVNASDPGCTATGLNGRVGAQAVAEGTDTSVRLATVGSDGDRGVHDRAGKVVC